MHIGSDVVLEPGDWVLCVDYFGLSGASVAEALSRFPAGRVVIDAAQSLFLTDQRALAVFYSPRKFVGLPDGGLLVTSLRIELPAKIERGSIRRCEHLLMRLDGRAEEGHPEFQKAERSLSEMILRRMSNLTATLLRSIDYNAVAARRRENYTLLAKQLGGFGEYAISLNADAVPLCYPLVGVNADRLRGLLSAHRIYTPRYWPDILETNGLSSWERLLLDQTVFLPCDQRYHLSEMAQLSEFVRKLL
jgi:hypothetical protein